MSRRKNDRRRPAWVISNMNILIYLFEKMRSNVCEQISGREICNLNTDADTGTDTDTDTITYT